MLTNREIAAQHIMSLVARTDRAFNENGGQEIFDAIRMLREFDKPKFDVGIDAAIGKFAKLGKWTEAEQALKLSQEGFSVGADLPSALSDILAKEQDLHRLRHWCELFKDSRKTYLLSGFCGYFLDENTKPRLETIEFVKDLIGQDSDYGNILPFLVVEFWAYGKRDAAMQILRSVDIDSRGQAAAHDIIRWALKNNEPELAMELIPRVTKRAFALTAYSWSSAILAGDADKLAQHEKWLSEQPKAVQISSKMGIVRRMVGSPINELKTDFPRH